MTIAQVQVCILFSSFNIASVEVSHITTELLICEHFRQLVPASPLLGPERSEPAQPLPLPWGCPQSSVAGSNHQGDVSFCTQPGPAGGGGPSCSPIYFANYKCSNIVMSIIIGLFSYFVFFFLTINF